MNVNSSTMYRTFLANVKRLDEQLATVNQQIATGKKLVNLRDGPAIGAESVRMQEESAELDQYIANTDSCGFYLQVTDSALNSVQNLVTSIQTNALEAASEALTAESRNAIASEIRSLRDQILSLANSEIDGRYIFAGSLITDLPFSLTGDTVSYNGDTEIREIKVGDDVTIRQNIAGTVFSPLFDAVASLLSEIDAGDSSGIAVAIEQVSTSLSSYNLARGQVGAELGKVERLQAELATEGVNLRARQSQVEDIDTAEAVTRLNQAQTTLNATMTAGQTILQQQNLFDFLA